MGDCCGRPRQTAGPRNPGSRLGDEPPIPAGSSEIPFIRRNVPGINTPYEGDFFIGYDHANKRYVAHLVNVFGGDEPTEGLLHGSRTGNEIKLVYKTVGDMTINQRFIWEPDSKSWHIVIRAEVAGKEGEPFLDIKVTAATHLQSENK